MLLSIPLDIINHEINKYLIDIDRQLLRKTCHYFNNLFKYEQIEFTTTDFELVHVKLYKKFWDTGMTKSSTINRAATKGDLECLKYIAENQDGCWDTKTIKYAAQGGYLD